jgi:cytosine/uracil/thiamine/allantoin permease
MSIFCVVSTPWNIIKNAAGLLSFLSGYSCLMGPLAGILVTDRAFFSFVLGFAPTLPGFARAIGGPKKVHVGGAWKVCCEQMREER